MCRPEIIGELLDLLIQMLAPMVHRTWLPNCGSRSDIETDLDRVPWPEFNAAMAKEDQAEVVIQINGRVKTKILVDSGLADEELVQRAISDPKIAQL